MNKNPQSLRATRACIYQAAIYSIRNNNYCIKKYMRIMILVFACFKNQKKVSKISKKNVTQREFANTIFVVFNKLDNNNNISRMKNK